MYIPSLLELVLNVNHGELVLGKTSNSVMSLRDVDAKSNGYLNIKLLSVHIEHGLLITLILF